MRISLLGPLEVLAADGRPADVGGARLRMLLARLALAAGRPVSAESLIADLWGEEPPAGAVSALQGLVSRLRKALGETGAVELVAGGYRLPVEPEDVDAHRFEELSAQGRRELAADRPREAARLLGAALDLWRGAALADVREAAFAANSATRLHDLRAAADEDRFDAELRLGRHAEVQADLAAAAAEHPLSERLAELRMRALSAAGRQSDALAVYEELRARLGDELGVDPSPELRKVHLALLRGELDRPVAQTEAAPSRLPARLTTFFGRESELGRLAELLDTARLVTIVGPGGAGKTRLSLEAASRLRARVWFVPLAGVSEPGQLADTVLGVLSSSDSRLFDSGQLREATPVDRIANLLDVGDGVLLLDNCEHLVEAAAELAQQLLERLPRLKIMATSREALAITGETLCHLGPLDLPPAEPEPAEAGQAAAVRLFVDRAAGVRPGFTLDATTVGDVVEICRRLDGMPLALELAAAKLRAMGVREIVRRLDDRFRLLTSGSRTALPRQRTLLALVEWSWDLLEEPERVLARRLSALPGGASLPALEVICADDRLPADEVLHVIGSLVDKSLVQEDEDRYRMLETVRAYAAGRLAESGDDITPQLSRYFLAFAEEQEPLLRTRDQLDAIAAFDAEHDNLIHALRSALTARDAVTTSRFVRALFWYWGIRGMSRQFETYVAEVLAFGDELPADVRAAFQVVQGVGAGVRSGEQPPSLDRRALGFHPAVPLFRLSQLASADQGQAELEHALNSPDPWVRASALWAQDFVRSQQGDVDTGAQARREALRAFEQVGDRWGMVMGLLEISMYEDMRGDHEQAISAAERAVVISSELGTEEHLAWAKGRLAAARARSGDLDGARRDLDAGLRQARGRGLRRLETTLLNHQAAVLRRSGKYREAHRTLDRLETFAHRTPLPEEIVRGLITGERVSLLLAEGDAARARELLPQAVRGAFAYGNPGHLATACEWLGRLLALEGDPKGAAAALGMGEKIKGLLDSGDPEIRALIGDLVGQLGEDGFQAAYREGAGLPRQQAIDRLAEVAGRSPSQDTGEHGQVARLR
ncbi:BTAD domain-containing putative transcriptional regulator [Nonomuraea rubra]|uniref:Putative ATPase/DNA-binding winged helix-turn-helix (WHTH) protein n=1 Tax=Nonomuraea rubra TaxID=46180 RepID=A0A7X0U3C9_9ACTN|nr:BTAD domain-containing putative transcriptional regulator [Nonomuraea rubra]MBB6553573.1 putative ATPase/DNA-binding winged helix-turn-helix (wHTH) protein [Nonomuraea rubra]